MNILELFAGSRSVGKEAEKLSFRVFSTDIEPFEKIDAITDIHKLNYNQIPFVPDVIWASPPCTSFSILSCRFHWMKDGNKYFAKTKTALEGIALVKRTFQIIRHFQKLNPKLIWYIENPRGLLRKMPIMQGLPIRQTVTYCQYGDNRMKPTDIWTNNKDWKPKAMCSPGSSCHVACPRGSNSGIQGLGSSYERAKIPLLLCKEILLSVFNPFK
ncbi:MAG: hypothetical protein POELPBGB_01313 [Bacteroidia bacterium]|nr:hypothetical protein [Bacteroidia bacterium]